MSGFEDFVFVLFSILRDPAVLFDFGNVALVAIAIRNIVALNVPEPWRWWLTGPFLGVVVILMLWKLAYLRRAQRPPPPGALTARVLVRDPAQSLNPTQTCGELPDATFRQLFPIEGKAIALSLLVLLSVGTGSGLWNDALVIQGSVVVVVFLCLHALISRVRYMVRGRILRVERRIWGRLYAAEEWNLSACGVACDMWEGVLVLRHGPRELTVLLGALFRPVAFATAVCTRAAAAEQAVREESGSPPGG